MGGIHHDNIDTGFGQGFSAGHAIFARTYRRPHQQTARRIFRRVRIGLGFFHILDRHKANTMMVIINDHQFFNPVGMKQFAGVIMADMFIRRHNIARHQRADAFKRVFGKAHITVGQNPHQFRAIRFSDGNTADAMLLH